MYTIEGLSIGEITRRLNTEGVPARKASRWERSVVWGVLRNPAYRGLACFGKTRISARTRVMRPQRRRGTTTPSNTAGHQRPREEWIEIPVPALVTEEAFARAQELLYHNKIRSRRRTIVRSVATPCREHRRKRVHGKFITTSALAPIAGGNWAAPCATITASFARNCS